MKKVRFILLLIVSAFILSGCQISFTPGGKTTTSRSATYVETTEYSVPNPNNPDGYKVTFDLGDGETYTSTTNTQGYVLAPNNPERNFAFFEGWYVNDQLFDFNTQVKSDITLYAKWEYDVTSLINHIYRNTIKACIKVETVLSKGGFITRSTTDSIGSGIIISEQNGYYYALTNNHVVYCDYTKYDNVEYIVYDSYNNEYSSGKVSLLYNKAEYDLALIRFRKGSQELAVVDLAKSSSTDKVFTLGNPKSLANAISFGDYLGMKTFTPKADSVAQSNVTFDVITHTAFIDNGSSGGGLLNYSLKLVGINFASSVSEKTGEFIRGYAIPVEKINEFITEYNIK